MVLEDLSVSKYGRLTNAGDILFSKNPAVRYPQTRAKAVCFAVEKSDGNYRDMKSFEGALVATLEEVYGFVLRNTPTKATFPNGALERTDEVLYPPAAVREGLVNAFAHRDYSGFSGGVSVFVYPDRLEIWNSGTFPEGITPEAIGNGHISILRNPDIAHVLYLRRYMEKLGRGSVLIRKACEDRNQPTPKWRSDNIGVTLTLFAPEVSPEVSPEVTPEVTPEVMRILGIMTGEMSRKEMQIKLSLKDDEYFRKSYLKPALQADIIEMTIPDSPRSSKQKYRMTTYGKMIIKTI